MACTKQSLGVIRKHRHSDNQRNKLTNRKNIDSNSVKVCNLAHQQFFLYEDGTSGKYYIKWMLKT